VQCHAKEGLNCKVAVMTNLQIDDAHETVHHCKAPDPSAVEVAVVATRMCQAVSDDGGWP